MNMLKVKRYYPQSNQLKGIIKYFWAIRSEKEESLSYKLLPVNNIDIVLNFAAPMIYISGKRSVTASRYSFTGIRNHHQTVDQSGKMNLFGVSFFPAGIYPILKTPIYEYSDKTIDFSILNKNFKSKIEGKFNPEGIISQQIEILEDLFLQLIDPYAVPEKRIFKLINAFCMSNTISTIKGFSDNFGINQRKLERIFRRYIGVSPKAFQRINRFQVALNRLLNSDLIDLTTVAYETCYYDQSHFIHDFRSFAGCSPSRFLKEKRSMKQMLTY